MYHCSMDTNLETYGDAIDAIQAGLKAPTVDRIRRDDTLHNLLQTVKAAAGLDESAVPDEAILKNQLPGNIKLLITQRLTEVGVLN